MLPVSQDERDDGAMMAQMRASSESIDQRGPDDLTLDGDDVQQAESDIVWVIVVRGRQTSLALFAIEWTGSLVSFSLVVNAGVPQGSAFIFFVNLVTFATAGIFLAPPFLMRMPARYRESARLRVLVLISVFWAALLSVLAFASAVVASREFVECRSLTYTGQCSRIQAAIAITFCISLALSASFFVSFLGSVVPRDRSVKTYLRGLAQAAAQRAAGSGRRFYRGGEDSVPLNVLTPRASNLSQTSPMSMGRRVHDAPAAPRLAVTPSKQAREWSTAAAQLDETTVDVMEIL